MEPSRDISRLLEIMARLRDPDTGCAWDVVQTFATIAPYTVEEAYEVADAIERDDMVDLPDELGDLLLQVVFHARIAEEAGAFDFGDVVAAITTKMIRRHPHVFGDETARSRTLAKGAWERIKAVEKAERAARHAQSAASGEGEPPSLLDDVPRALPALIRAHKMQKRAATVGFDWDQAEPILDKIREETDELADAMTGPHKAAIAEEFGDLLFAVVNLGRHLDVEPEAALHAASAKFAARFAKMEQTLVANGTSVDDASLDVMEDAWTTVKHAERKTAD